MTGQTCAICGSRQATSEEVARLDQMSALVEALRQIASFDAGGDWFVRDIIEVAKRALAELENTQPS